MKQQDFPVIKLPTKGQLRYSSHSAQYMLERTLMDGMMLEWSRDVQYTQRMDKPQMLSTSLNLHANSVPSNVSGRWYEPGAPRTRRTSGPH